MNVIVCLMITLWFFFIPHLLEYISDWPIGVFGYTFAFIAFICSIWDLRRLEKTSELELKSNKED